MIEVKRITVIIWLSLIFIINIFEYIRLMGVRKIMDTTFFINKNLTTWIKEKIINRSNSTIWYHWAPLLIISWKRVKEFSLSIFNCFRKLLMNASAILLTSSFSFSITIFLLINNFFLSELSLSPLLLLLLKLFP